MGWGGGWRESEVKKDISGDGRRNHLLCPRGVPCRGVPEAEQKGRSPSAAPPESVSGGVPAEP